MRRWETSLSGKAQVKARGESSPSAPSPLDLERGPVTPGAEGAVRVQGLRRLLLPTRARFGGASLVVALVASGAGLADSVSAQAADTESARAVAGLPEGQTAFAELGPEQLRAQSEGIVNGVEAASKRIAKQTRKASEEGDVVKTLCLDDKRQQMETAQSTIRDRQSSLLDALTAGGLDSARHHYSLVVVLGERVAVLVEEATQCVGEETSLTDDDTGGQLLLVIEEGLPDIQPDVVNLTPIVSITPSVNSAVD